MTDSISAGPLDLYFLLKPNQLRNVMMKDIAQSRTGNRTVEFELRVIVPAATPMADVAQAMTRLAASVNGTWRYSCPPGAPHGRFEVEAQP